MAGKGRQSWEKRQREKSKRDRQALKRERREDKTVDEDGVEIDAAAPTEAELYERFAKLSQRHAAGEIEDDAFETARAELFEQLGIETS